MNKYKETQDTWDKLSEIYQEKFSALEIYHNSYNAVLDKCKANSIILDMACATGIISQYINNYRTDIVCDLLDASKCMIDLAKTKVNYRNAFIADLTDLNFIIEKYDAIFCGFGIPFLDKYDLTQFIKNTKNLLNNCGYIYINYVQSNNDFQEIKESNFGKVNFHYHSDETLKELFEDNSFKVIEEFTIEFPKNENTIEIHKAVILTL